ncbi:YraN family protein [Pseudonocardia sp. EV170527-09]|uniref:YraN family protein n=1 Tax=Pseudonocardia sp. EV170527-09 TaxID=2603411 RepID=UPI0011F3FD98|nr:YraN family protein [Pseudonocardia sp. EV170527-09]KAA1032683.1 YraN family protein [Pseudonocardia sp. EV170527-09]
MAAKDELGRRGEDTAAEYLERAHGMVVLSRNWRCTHGEIDIVAVDPERRLVFCEVKTRSGLRYGEPAEAVTPRKTRRIRLLAKAFMAAHRVSWVEIRFDVVAVLIRPGRPVTLTHYPAAF